MGNKEKETFDLLISQIQKEIAKKGLYSEDLSNLLSLLRQSKLSFDQRTHFSGQRWDHYSEYYVFTIDPSLTEALEKHKATLEEICNRIFDNDGDFDFSGVEIKPGYVSGVAAVQPETTFEQIERQVMTEIDKTKYCLFIAMAWFTNPDIFDLVNELADKGVVVCAVLDNNSKNIEFLRIHKAHFEIRLASITSQYTNLMHEKFCIIDQKVVLHGTYNWTGAANYNKEDMTVDRNAGTVDSFSSQFIELRKISE